MEFMIRFNHKEIPGECQPGWRPGWNRSASHTLPLIAFKIEPSRL
jgi:hypothetical protein